MRLKIYSILMFIATLYSTSSLAQKISGKITSAGKILSGANVVVTPSGKGAATNENGSYTLSLKPGTYKVVFSILGFDKQTKTITLVEGDDKILNVELSPTSENISEVVVLGSRGAGSTRTASPVPVDIIHVNEAGQTTAKPDLMSQ